MTGIGLGAGGMSTIVAIIGKTAPTEKKSMAMGIAAASASFGQFIFIAPVTIPMEDKLYFPIFLLIFGFNLSIRISYNSVRSYYIIRANMK